MSDAEFVTAEQMAEMHKVSKLTIWRILEADKSRPESERRIPGATKVGSKYRGEWRIPVESARSWKNRGRGRPSKTE